ncbi:Brp/Blh family beta-carotene 15,15'-dioxygenase [Blastomonas aquatica]|uniref:Beta-carotene 15,15'-dioxygenase n=1 Tax=Blastomonas aquatica TaxID=1510276 RepID=A0ABQ1IZ58_9SPHN|nr:Brp/Blh family beta-carotene 15,15'-dioxygenase [Blastomonas aquatica]GGB53750.1 hypothetical protein GCM10010833_05540 [Blastomonas aquatica]
MAQTVFLPLPLRLDRGAPGWLLVFTCLAIALHFADLLPQTAAAIAVLSATLMVVGMPHGSFDIALLQRGSSDGAAMLSRTALIGLYLACALAMYLLWQIAPAWGLGIFLLMAAVHFSEDWQRCGSPFIATGMALAFLSAPVLLHSESLTGLFAVLSNDTAARLLVDLMVLIAPTMVMLAVAGAGMLWHAGERNRALSAVCGLAAMLVLPPVHGFALFFCLVHSPIQFADHSRALGLRGVRQWGGTVIPLTLGGLAVAAGIFLANRSAVLTDDVFASSFIALSVLTAPHMLVPMILRLRSPARAQASPQSPQPSAR